MRLFYRGDSASLVGPPDRRRQHHAVRHRASVHGAEGLKIESVLLARSDISSLFGFTRSYFHVDLPVVSAAVSLLRTFMPGKAVDELYTILGRAKQGKTERYYALRRHLAQSFDVFVHAPGQRGLVMVVFTLPSHDLVFKVIRDRFGPPKNIDARGGHGQVQVGLRTRSRRPARRRAGIQTAASAAGALHAGIARRNC